MSVRTRITLAAMVSLAACDGFDAQPPSPVSSGSSASLAPAAAIAEEAGRLARAAADAALAAAKTCIIVAPSFDDAADNCPVTQADVSPLTQSAAALDAFVQKNTTAVPADVKAFAAVVQSFAEWLRQGLKFGGTRGTLKLFQDVADTWNTYRPKDPLPVDPVDEFRLMGHGSKGYIMKPMKKTDGRVVWKSCYDGPCLWENHY